MDMTEPAIGQSKLHVNQKSKKSELQQWENTILKNTNKKTGKALDQENQEKTEVSRSFCRTA